MVTVSTESSESLSSPRARAWNAALTASPGDLDREGLEVEGALPADLVGGRYLLNGPGWVSIGGRLVHPFDGHGYVRAIRFEPEGRVSLRARFVRTRAYVDEARAGRVIHRGLATRPHDAWWRNVLADGPRNVANTTVVPWAGRLLCGWEGGLPHAIDPETLETRGPEGFGGALPPGAVLAHMRVDAPRDRLVTLTLGMGRTTKLTFRELDRSGHLVGAREVSIPGSLFAHDFFVTPHWYVLAGNPLAIDVGAFVRARLGAGDLLQAIRADDAAPGTLHLVPREGEGPVRTVRVDRRLFVVHFANAFEEGGDVIVDTCAFERFVFGNEFGWQGPDAPLDPALPDRRAAQELGRVRIAEGARDARWERLSTLGCDFPRVADALEGRDAPAVYVATRAAEGRSDPFDSVARIDLRARGPASRWTAPEGTFVGEPVFVPRRSARPEDDDGFVLAMLYDGLGARSELALFESQAIARGPRARVRLPLLPYGFHGAWLPPS
jgi:carotenoid cleavage dioxygenase-like enzyme